MSKKQAIKKGVGTKVCVAGEVTSPAAVFEQGWDPQENLKK